MSTFFRDSILLQDLGLKASFFSDQAQLQAFQFRTINLTVISRVLYQRQDLEHVKYHL